MHEFTLVSPAVYSTSIGRGETELPTPLSYLRLISVTDTHPDTDFAQTELSTLSVRLRTDMSLPQI